MAPYCYDQDGWWDCQDNCPDTPNPDQADSDCDGVGDLCDVCPGGDDKIDNNQDGLPDCAYPPDFADIIDAWKCEDHKVLVCHKYDKNPTVICIDTSALQAHMDHGDFLGPCNAANCEIESSIPTHTHFHQPEEMFVFPNPFSDIVHVRLNSSEVGKAILTIFNREGKRMMPPKEWPLQKGTNTIQLEGQQLISGLYFIQVLLPSGEMKYKRVVANR